jgi:hypothetical protein
MIEPVFAMIETNAGESARLLEATGLYATCSPIRHRMSTLFPHPTAISISVGRVMGQKYQSRRGTLGSITRVSVQGLRGRNLVLVGMYCGTSATPWMYSRNRMRLAKQCPFSHLAHSG